MKFTKMHGAGNDYVYIDGFRQEVLDPASLAIRVSDRHKGVGSDGLVLILPSDTCDFRMRMFNADGSEAAMCGNAARCVGKYVFDEGYTDRLTVSLETLAGVKILHLMPVDGKVERVRVDMGQPEFAAGAVPIDWPGADLIGERVRFGDLEVRLTAVSMGNPHAVLFLDENFLGVKDLEGLDIETVGRMIENAPLFPQRTNVEFVEILSPARARMRVWERGSGETLACGTGACAVLAAAVTVGKLGREAVIELRGGELELAWEAGTNHVWMTGPAVRVFDGEMDL
jgi:diaminopimelate epimerase